MNNSENDDERDETIDEDPRAAAQDSVQCPACFRRMRRAVFANHPNICRENPTKKRHVSVFDMTRYRSIRSGDKVLPVRKISPIATNPSHSHSLRPSQTRSAKRDRRSDTVVPPIINSFCCPTCKRTFCEKAYDRHVAFCTSKLKQVQQAPSEETLLARLKLDRRIKFGANRLCSTLTNTPAVIGSSSSNPQAPLSTRTVKQKPSLPADALCFLALRKKQSDALARCPWCSKPYMPNCIHYCRGSKELFSIHSK